MDEKFADNAMLASPEWKRPAADGALHPEIDDRLIAGDQPTEDGSLAVHSLSGKERNHLFLNGNAGEDFTDVSALSGMDSASDSRSFALLDYDHDGWQDVAMVNANQPLTQLFHNDIAELPGAKGGMIAIRFVGGNVTSSASEWGNRDGYGAMVEVGLPGGVKLKREHRCGEGYAAQNSTTMLIGLGAADGAESLSVRWPSGKTFTLEKVAEGTLVTAYEDRPAGPFTQKPYRLPRTAAIDAVEREKFPLARTTTGKVQVYTTTATWCAACLNHLPELTRLKEDGVALYGVPTDPGDDAAKLDDYVARRQPAYEMLAPLGDEEREKTISFLTRALRTEDPVLPTSVITDGEGNVLEVMTGVPTLSQVRKWRVAP